MNLVQFKRNAAAADVFINPAHVAMVESSGIGDGNVTDIVPQPDKRRRKLAGSASPRRRAKKTKAWRPHRRGIPTASLLELDGEKTKHRRRPDGKIN